MILYMSIMSKNNKSNESLLQKGINASIKGINIL